MKIQTKPFQCALAAMGIAAVVMSSAGICGAERVVTSPDAENNVPSGRQLYVSHCAACHGDTGKGDGRAACDFTTRPADLTDDATAGATDRELLRHLSHPPKPMPSYDTLLNDTERHEIVRYLRSLADKGMR